MSPMIHYKAYDARFKVYDDGSLNLKIYNSMIVCDKRDERRKRKSKFNEILDKECSKNGRVAVKDLDKLSHVDVQSLARSRQLVIDYACANPVWNSFLTLTIADNITDVSIANKLFSKWRKQFTKACSKNGLEFKYLCVPEFQERGAVHYHLLTNIVPGTDLLPLQKGKENMYDVKYWKHGFTSVFDPTKADSKFNIALYITKYLYKNLDSRLYGHTRVLKSNNLKKPNEFYLLSTSDTYNYAMRYIKEKYDIKHVYKSQPNLDNEYIIPSTIIDFKSHTDDSILVDILQNDLEF